MRKFLTTEQFIIKAKSIHHDKYDYTQVKYIDSKTKVKIYCKACKTYFYQSPNSHLAGKGCAKCYKRTGLKPFTKEQFISKAKQIHGDKYDYSKVNYKNNREKILIYCKKCHKYFLQIPCNHIAGKGCPHCIKSKGELKIQDILDRLHIIYIPQKRFNACRDKYPLPFDFYLPEYNTCIEYQGQQHYKHGIAFFICKHSNLKNAKWAFKEQKKRDTIKRNYCKDNNIILSEICYNDNIEQKIMEIINAKKEICY